MLSNPYIVIPFATWLIAQTIKFAVAAMRGEVNYKYLYASGGMPSVHSAVVAALATTSLVLDGASSHIFGFTLLFAAIVMYDSFGVRRSAGEQAVAINMIMTSLEHDKVKLARGDLKLREVLGHKPAEVTAGALLGVVLALLFNTSHLTTQINFLTALPGHRELVVYAVLFGLLVVLGWVGVVWLRLSYKGSQIMQRVARSLAFLTQTIGWLGLVVVFGQYQHLPYLSFRVWVWLLIVVAGAWKAYYLKKYWRLVPEQLHAESEVRRKTKWFGRRKKR